MLVTTEALVLSKTNYSETSLIVRCYTRSDGIKSYIVKSAKQGRKGNKTTALFQPLHQCFQPYRKPAQEYHRSRH